MRSLLAPRRRTPPGEHRCRNPIISTQTRPSHALNWQTRHERFDIDLNSASEEELADLPMVGAERARRLIEHRHFESWEDIERVPGFDLGMIDDLRSGGAQIGGKRF